MATTTSTQRQLVEHAAAGDEGAFESLVRLSAGRLLAIAYRILRDHHLAGVADRDQVERGFRQLKPDQRAILVLQHYVGLSLAEIADVLGIPVGTAGSRLHYAARAFRAALDADDRASETKERTA